MLLAGVRTSVIINIGTAAIASTVGAKTLGSPIIVGLSGFNTAYVIQGALVVASLAVVVDLAFERLCAPAAALADDALTRLSSSCWRVRGHPCRRVPSIR